MQRTIVVETPGRGLHEVTDRVSAFVAESTRSSGLCVVFLRHTSASLLIQENADPTVRRDMEEFFARLAPDGDPRHRHDAEGPDDMPAHIRAALTQPSLAIPILEGRLALGTWQGIYLYEHRLRPHRRELVVGVYAEPT